MRRPRPPRTLHVGAALWAALAGLCGAQDTLPMPGVRRNLAQEIFSHPCWGRERLYAKGRWPGDRPFGHPFECCNPALGPRGNESCWSGARQYATCCNLAGFPRSPKYENRLATGSGANQWVVFAKIFQYLESDWHEPIPGDYVELGVWEGQSAALAATAMHELRRPRRMWLYDSWLGFPQTTEVDGKYAESLVGALTGPQATPQAVLRRVLRTGYDRQLVNIRQGYFNETLPKGAATGDIAQQIAFLHLDADWYESIMQSLDAFYDKVPPGGVVVFDDFGYFEGTRRAFYDFFRKREEYPLLERSGQTIAWFVKGVEHNRIN